MQRMIYRIMKFKGSKCNCSLEMREICMGICLIGFILLRQDLIWVLKDVEDLDR